MVSMTETCTRAPLNGHWQLLSAPSVQVRGPGHALADVNCTLAMTWQLSSVAAAGGAIGMPGSLSTAQETRHANGASCARVIFMPLRPATLKPSPEACHPPL